MQSHDEERRLILGDYSASMYQSLTQKLRIQQLGGGEQRGRMKWPCDQIRGRDPVVMSRRQRVGQMIQPTILNVSKYL